MINVIEIDLRNATYQSGIAKYWSCLAPHMPEDVRTYRVVFYAMAGIRDVRIVPGDEELSVYMPVGFPSQTLYESVYAFLGERLVSSKNLIIKSNCLGCEGLAYLIRSRVWCKTLGVLHCLPHRSMGANGQFPPANPFFNMDHVIGVCDLAHEYFNGVKNTRPTSIIYNGLDVPKIKNKKKKDGVFRFIFANGLSPHKGLQRILPAIRHVASRHPIEVIVLGGCADDVKLANEFQGLPINYVGLVTDDAVIQSYYEQADCALFASFSEACSYAGIEAMAYNLPIISSDAAGLVEMFDKAALYAKTGPDGRLDADEYALHMLHVIEQSRLRTQLAVRAYARYLARYTAKRMASKTVELYRKLLAQS